MSGVKKVIEVLAESPKSWEDAVTAAVVKASESVHGIRSVYIKEFEAQVDNNEEAQQATSGSSGVYLRGPMSPPQRPISRERHSLIQLEGQK